MRPVFFDTNLVLYLLSADEHKANTAEALLAQGGMVSVQVLNEAVSVCRRKLSLTWPEVHAFLDGVKAYCEVLPLTLATHERALYRPNATNFRSTTPSSAPRRNRLVPRCFIARICRMASCWGS